MKDAFELVGEGKTLIFSHQLNDATGLSSDGYHPSWQPDDQWLGREVRQSTGDMPQKIRGGRRSEWPGLNRLCLFATSSYHADHVESVCRMRCPRDSANSDRPRYAGNNVRDRYPSLNDVFLNLVRQMPTDLQPTEEELAVPDSVLN